MSLMKIKKIVFFLFIAAFSNNLMEYSIVYAMEASESSSSEEGEKTLHVKRQADKSGLEKHRSKKRRRDEERKEPSSSSSSSQSEQVYSVPTYDATFKYVMSDPRILMSFLNTFILDAKITSVAPKTTHLTPLSEDTRVRNFLYNAKQLGSKIKTFLNKRQMKEEEFALCYRQHLIKGGGTFVVDFFASLQDLEGLLPPRKRNSQVDVICKLDDGTYALVEVQVVPQNFSDQQALSYASYIYSQQMKEGNVWDSFKKVICINILSGGPQSTKWEEKTRVTRYTFKDPEGNELEDGIEIFQYPLYHPNLRQIPPELEEKSQKNAYLDWINFLEHAQDMTEDEVAQGVMTLEVKQAYQKVKLLPPEVVRDNRRQDEEQFSLSTRQTAALLEKGRKEGTLRLLVKLLKDGVITSKKFQEETRMTLEDAMNRLKEMRPNDE